MSEPTNAASLSLAYGAAQRKANADLESLISRIEEEVERNYDRARALFAMQEEHKVGSTDRARLHGKEVAFQTAAQDLRAILAEFGRSDV